MLTVALAAWAYAVCTQRGLLRLQDEVGTNYKQILITFLKICSLKLHLMRFSHPHLETSEDLPFSVRHSECFPVSAWPETIMTCFCLSISTGNLPCDLACSEELKWMNRAKPLRATKLMGTREGCAVSTSQMEPSVSADDGFLLMTGESRNNQIPFSKYATARSAEISFTWSEQVAFRYPRKCDYV